MVLGQGLGRRLRAALGRGPGPALEIGNRARDSVQQWAVDLGWRLGLGLRMSCVWTWARDSGRHCAVDSGWYWAVDLGQHWAVAAGRELRLAQGC